MHNPPIISFLEAHSPANYIDVQDVYYLYERETFVPLMNVPQQPRLGAPVRTRTPTTTTRRTVWSWPWKES